MKTYLDSSASPKIVQAIGRITVEFAALERTLSEGMGWLLILIVKNDSVEIDATTLAEILTAEMSFKTKVDTLGALIRHLIKAKTLYQKTQNQLLEKSDALLKEIARVEEKRNIVTHSLWIRGDSSTTAIRIKLKAKKTDGLSRHEENMKLEELKSIAKSIRQVRQRLYNFVVLELLTNILVARTFREKQEKHEVR